MNAEQIKKILEEHKDWLNNNDSGKRANLRDANLQDADLWGANLQDADLQDANLQDANLRGANLRDANLRGANLWDADLWGANLQDADLWGADLRDADLQDADLRVANLRDANLSNVKGILTAKHYLSQFEADDKGVLVYKTFGVFKTPPDYWKIEEGAFIEEVVNPDRCTDCGSGVNFGTMEWIEKHVEPRKKIWLCRISWLDLADMVVPFGTDGKARCARLELIKVLEA